MAERVIDPDRFLLFASPVDWLAVQKRQQKPEPAELLAKRRGISTRVVQLRWLTAPGLGYPTEPFKVWRRPAIPFELEKKLAPISYPTPFGWRAFASPAPMVYVRARLNVTGGATVVAFAGAPFASAVVGIESVTAGIRSVSFSGPSILVLAVIGNATLDEMVGISGDAAAAGEGWELVERVGLPVEPGEWSGVFDLDSKQGLETALGLPIDAARDRFRRGAPLYGWPDFMEPGRPAPAWRLADPDAIIKVLHADLLGDLHKMITTRPPDQHAGFRRDEGLAMDGGPEQATASYAPLHALLFAAATDPLASLVAGFGTAFDDVDLPPIVLSDRQLFGDPTRSDWDFMVTARYAKGRDGQSDPVEYAAILRAPKFALPPPPPANLAITTDGMRSPPATDRPWLPVVRLAWDKLPDSTPFRAASYAAARSAQPPAGLAEPLMGKRKFDEALQPISATTSPEEEQTTGRLRALDESFALPGAPSPTQLVYGVAQQDLFGLWSNWSVRPHQLAEPPVQGVPILSASLEPLLPAAGAVCPGRLVIDFSWDWSSRSLRRVRFVGRLYAQARRGDPPASLSVPAGLQKALGGPPGTAFEVRFDGAPAGTPDAGGSLRHLAADGRTFLPGPATDAGPRRYRLTIEGFQLDFGAAGHIGLALWAMGEENRPPQRPGPWSKQPSVASASDPRPPVILLEREDVLLASMADARGEHHARLDWPAAAGAVGYFIYTTTESKLRADHGLPDPSPDLTLSQRLAELRQRLRINPDRRFFTRINDAPIAATSTEVTIPRGSKEIHLYLVLGVSAGQVESPWPDLGDPKREKRFIAYAAPQQVVPAPPVLEVRRVLDAGATPPFFKARVLIRTQPGAVVTRLDLHRVRVPEASLHLDMMGPPVASLTGPAPGWQIAATPADGPVRAQPLGRVEGHDAPSGSWKRVFYRAVAWSADDPERGILGGRSAPSAAQEVVIPPAGPPDLDPLAWSWPGGPLGDIEIATATGVPVAATPLGPHRLRVEALTQKPDGTLVPLFAWPVAPAPDAAADGRFEAVPTAPPPAGTHGLWRAPAAGRTQLRLLLRRASFDEAIKVRLQLDDPLGRSSERILDVPAGSPLPAPDITAPVVTKVPGKGFVLVFTTSVPVAATPAGPYRLRVQYEPVLILPTPLPLPIPPIQPRPPIQPLPPLRPIPLPARPGSGSAMVEAALAEIRVARPGDDPFAEGVPIPLRRAKAMPAGTQIAVYLRGTTGGAVTLTLTAPDGRAAKLSRKVR